MHSTFRGVARFSSGGFTYARIAFKLYFNAPSETSAQTGLRSKSILLLRLVAMRIPELLILRHPHTSNVRAKTVARERQQAHVHANRRWEEFRGSAPHSE